MDIAFLKVEHEEVEIRNKNLIPGSRYSYFKRKESEFVKVEKENKTIKERRRKCEDNLIIEDDKIVKMMQMKYCTLHLKILIRGLRILNTSSDQNN